MRTPSRSNIRDGIQVDWGRMLLFLEPQGRCRNFVHRSTRRWSLLGTTDGKCLYARQGVEPPRRQSTISRYFVVDLSTSVQTRSFRDSRSRNSNNVLEELHCVGRTTTTVQHPPDLQTHGVLGQGVPACGKNDVPYTSLKPARPASTRHQLGL